MWTLLLFLSGLYSLFLAITGQWSCTSFRGSSSVSCQSPLMSLLVAVFCIGWGIARVRQGPK